MTGADLARIERLPDASGLRDEVVIQMGHMVGYGAAVEQGIRLAGARVVPVGKATDARGYQLGGSGAHGGRALRRVASRRAVRAAAADRFARICRARGVPVIADLASEYDLKGFLAAGADIAVYSAHKFLGGLTAGIVAGRKDLVRAPFLQNGGIGRGMKVGKESIVGAIAALEAWGRRDHARCATSRRAISISGCSASPGCPACSPAHSRSDRQSARPADVRVVPGPAHHRLGSGRRARRRQPAGDRARSRGRAGLLQLDPCNLHPGEAEQVADRIRGGAETGRRPQADDRILCLGTEGPPLRAAPSVA